MEKPSNTIRELADRLLAAENGDGRAALRVSEKLRVSLTRFAGREGSKSLMRRSLAIAKAEVPALIDVKLNADGTFEGFEELAEDDGGAAAAAAVTHLLSLLSTFIGESLTIRIIREAWPEITFEANPDEEVN